MEHMKARAGVDELRAGSLGLGPPVDDGTAHLGLVPPFHEAREAIPEQRRRIEQGAGRRHGWLRQRAHEERRSLRTAVSTAAAR